MLSAVRTGRLYSQGNIPGTHCCQRLSRPQGQSAARRIMSKENSEYTIGKGTRNFPACSAVVKQGCCKVTLIYYIVVSFKFWCKLPEDGTNDAETCSCTHGAIWELCAEQVKKRWSTVTGVFGGGGFRCECYEVSGICVRAGSMLATMNTGS